MAYINVPSAASTPLRITWSGMIGAIALTALLGCSASGHLNSLAEAKQIAATCPPGLHIAGRAAIDVGGDRLAVASDPGRLAPVRQLAERVAICGGHLRIDLFAGAAGATAAVFDGDLHTPGATETARLRRVPKLVDDVMNTVTTNLPTAAATLSRDGTDVVAQFGLSSEYVHQFGTGYVLDLVITTDGEQTAPPSLTDPALTTERAMQLASQVAAPNLSGAEIQLTDIGKAPGRSLPTGAVDALKAFYRTICEATGAATCTIVTDAAGR